MAEAVNVELEEQEPEITKEAPETIKPINKETVHKICSGQVVLTLAVAVKELVENSVDAGATLVEIKLHDQGMESIEVSDNGCGVTEANLEGMTAKYHTSKIEEFVDLLNVETFGFRGEALSSLCALSSMSITTRHKDSVVAIKIDLDHNGKIVKRSCCSRSIGTTVTLRQLFETLPVRRRDFMRNIKREFTKMCNMMQAYCLVAKGVRVICSNHTTKGGKTVILQTHGAMDVLPNISAIFGVKQTNELLEFKPAFENFNRLTKETLLEELTMVDNKADTLQINDDDMDCLKLGQFRFEGYISSCSHGFGRSAKDRQFFYINSRPCDSKNLSKTVNDIYHRYNPNQYPFVYLNVIIKRTNVDVNVTPDKRLLLIKNEKILLMMLKKSLLNTFGNTPAQQRLEKTSISSIFKVQPKTESPIVKEEIQKKADTQPEEDTLVPISTTKNFLDVLSQWRRTGDTAGPAPPIRVTGTKRKYINEIEARTQKMRKIQEYLTQELPKSTEGNNFASYKSESESDNEVDNSAVEATSPNKSFSCSEKINKASKEYDLILSGSTVERIDCKVSGPAKSFLTFIKEKPTNVQYDSEGDSLPKTQKSTTSKERDEFCLPSTSKASYSATEIKSPKVSNIHSDSEDESSYFTKNYRNQMESESELSLADNKTKSSSEDENEADDSKINIILDEPDEDSEPMTNISCAVMKTSLDEIVASMEAEEKYVEERRAMKKLKRLRFKSDINPNENKKAEEELQTEISKSDFIRMEIIGQFNLGFIIVKLDDDLFIVDQHASDEKYNFEKLQETTVVQSQRLVVPQKLELTVVNEMILLDHLQVFEKNGFQFEINENAPPMHKVRLVAKPISKNWEFGKEDIDELIFMLQDSPAGTICRPSRMRAMFASRACRKSVMIGKRLNEVDMKNVITHMGEIEQPWNCPHGRPTIRHLINLTALTEDSDSGSDSDYTDGSSDTTSSKADNDEK